MIGFFKKPKIKETIIKIKISVYVEKDGDGFVVYCPELKGLIADGATEDEALGRFTDASHAYLMSIIKHGDPITICTATKGEDLPANPIKRDIEIPLDIILNDSRDNYYRSA